MSLIVFATDAHASLKSMLGFRRFQVFAPLVAYLVCLLQRPSGPRDFFGVQVKQRYRLAGLRSKGPRHLSCVSRGLWGHEALGWAREFRAMQQGPLVPFPASVCVFGIDLRLGHNLCIGVKMLACVSHTKIEKRDTHHSPGHILSYRLLVAAP